jgi:DNA-binding winged helix-turn-helix (wHTH) protein
MSTSMELDTATEQPRRRESRSDGRDPTSRLIGYRAFQLLWQRAAQGSTRIPRAEARAEQLWHRALRAARSLNLVGELERGPTGPAVTPSRIDSSRPSRLLELVVHTPSIRIRTSRRIADGLLRLLEPDLMVDMSRQCASMAGEPLNLHGQRIFLGILSTLMLASGGPVSAADLFTGAWERRYNAEFDHSTLFHHISRLRSLTPLARGDQVVASVPGGYMLSPTVSYVLVEPAPRSGIPAGNRWGLYRTLEDRRIIDNRSYRELVGVSRATALRQLAALVATGILVREGDGRGARYRYARARVPDGHE